MAITLQAPDIRELKPRITVFGVGGAGGNAVNNMIESGLLGCEFVVANTDAQALTSSKAERVIQMGLGVTQGLGAGSHPEVGSAAADEVIDEIRDQLSGAHMCFITAGMGGGTGTGAAPVIARAARDMGILTVGVVTKPFQFEGMRRMRTAESGIQELQAAVDTLIVIPNQNLFRVANEKTTFADAFAMADQVLYSGVACITDLMVKEGLINLDFADVRAIMRGMGKAMMGTGEASGEKRANRAAEAAIANPLLDDVSMKGARGLLISITGGSDLTLYELDEAATRIREEVDQDANIILGATFDESLDGIIRVSVVATGIEPALISANSPNNPAIAETEQRIAEVAERLARRGPRAPPRRCRASAPSRSPRRRAPPRPAPLSAPECAQSRMETRIEAAAPVTRDDVVLAPVQAAPRASSSRPPRAARRGGARRRGRPVRAAASGRPDGHAARPRPAHAADPRAAADRPDADHGEPRCRGDCPGIQADLAAAPARDRGLRRPPRGHGRRPGGPSGLGRRPAAAHGSAAHGSASRAAGPARSGRARGPAVPPGPGQPRRAGPGRASAADDGRRSARDPGLPPPPGELTGPGLQHGLGLAGNRRPLRAAAKQLMVVAVVW